MIHRPILASSLVLSLVAAGFLCATSAWAVPAKSGAASKSSGASKSDSSAKTGASSKSSIAAKTDSAKSGTSSKGSAAPKAAATPRTVPAPKAAPPASPKSRIVLVKADEATMRAEASSKGKTVDTLTQFTPVQTLDTEDKYTKVQAGDKTGYILTASLTDSPFVSTTLSGDERIKVRATAAADALELMTLGSSHYPLRVLDKDGKRVKVVDYEGDGGWVHESYLSFTRYVIAKPPAGQGDWINLRDKPGLDKSGKALGAKRFMAEKGNTFQVLEEQGGWLRVKHTDNDEGWCSANLVWGWTAKDDAAPAAAKPAAAQ